jgi:hypothetical protein
METPTAELMESTTYERFCGKTGSRCSSDGELLRNESEGKGMSAKTEVEHMQAMDAVHERIESFVREYSMLMDAIYVLVTDEEFMARFSRFRDACMEAK